MPLALLALGLSSAVQAQQTGTIEGRVTHATTQRPLAGVIVGIDGSTRDALTNGTGHFRLAGIPAGERTVRLRLIGHAPSARRVTVLAGDTMRLDVAMSQTSTTLHEVIVTGTGEKVETRTLGNTVAIVTPPEIPSTRTLSEVIQGREPGVVGLSSGGITGTGARIRIRGNASLSQSNEPIVYVDGIRINSAGGTTVANGGGAGSSRLDDIDPSTIDRLEILKGATAATLYGTDASNGVIQIFTKRGSQGRTTWQLNAEGSASNNITARIPDNVGFARTQGRADSLSVFYGRAIKPFEMITTRPIDDLLHTGFGQVYSAQVSGGTPRSTVFASARHDGDAGTFGNRDLGPSVSAARRTQTNANVVFVPTPRVQLQARSSYTRALFEAPQNNNNTSSPIAMGFLAKPEEANCRRSAIDNPALALSLGVQSPGRCVSTGNPYGNASFGTLRELMQIRSRQQIDRAIASLAGSVDLSEGFRATLTAGVDVGRQHDRTDRPAGYNIDHVVATDTAGSRISRTQTSRDITLDSKVSWTKDVSPRIASQLVIGAQGFINDTRISGGSGLAVPSSGFEASGSSLTRTLSEADRSTVDGALFAQEQVGFDNWLFATIGGRYDYSSASGTRVPGVFYPKLSLSVVPSDWPSWRSRLGISSLRIRGAVGQSGRRPGAFDQVTTFAPLPGATGIGRLPNDPGNLSLRPEIATEAEVGFELGLYHDRASIQSTAWRRRVVDALVQVPEAPAGGFQNIKVANIGVLSAQGLELGINAIAVDRPQLQLTVFANAAFLDQTVDRLGVAPFKIPAGGARYRNFLREGYAPGAMFGAERVRPCSLRPAGKSYTCTTVDQLPFDLDRDGVPDSRAQMLAYLSQSRLTSNLPIMLVDQDGDGVFDDHFQGKPQPDWTGAFGFTLTLRRNLRVNTLLEYRTGFAMSNITSAFRNSSPGVGQNTRAFSQVEADLANPTSTPEKRLAAAERWTNLIALSPQDGLNQTEPGDFVRFRELGVSYDLPNSIATKLARASRARLSLSGRNLALWTRYSGVDPENNSQGRGGSTTESVNNFAESIDAWGLPLQRRFTVAIQLSY